MGREGHGPKVGNCVYLRSLKRGRRACLHAGNLYEEPIRFEFDRVDNIKPIAV